MGAIDAVQGLYDAYRRREIEEALGHCDDGVVFRWIAEPEQSRYAGICRSKPEFLDRLQALAGDFEYEDLKVTDLIESGDRVAAQVELHMVHHKTGKKFVMRTADFFTVRNGRIVEMVEYYDTQLGASVLDGG